MCGAINVLKSKSCETLSLKVYLYRTRPRTRLGGVREGMV